MLERWREWISSVLAEVLSWFRNIRVQAGVEPRAGLPAEVRRVHESPNERLSETPREPHQVRQALETTSPQLKAIEKARQQMIAARNYFDCVTEPELVDIAIYSLQAAQLRYSYLIRQAKQDNVHVPVLSRMLTKSH